MFNSLISVHIYKPSCKPIQFLAVSIMTNCCDTENLNPNQIRVKEPKSLSSEMTCQFFYLSCHFVLQKPQRKDVAYTDKHTDTCTHTHAQAYTFHAEGYPEAKQLQYL